jgi:hypothetical protein
LKVLAHQIKDVLYAVLPIIFIVIILHFTLAPLDMMSLSRFLIGSVMIVMGLSIFLIGVEIGITPIGKLMGSAMTKSGKIWIVGLAGIILGFIISIAEPDLHILAGQVALVTGGVVTKWNLVIIVSMGISVMLSIGLVRILYNFPLYKLLFIMYSLILVLSFFTSREFLAIAFDASGATTGALTVPFVLALAVGVSILKKDTKANEKDSFGLVAIASGGAIIAVLITSLLLDTSSLTGSLETGSSINESLMQPFWDKFQLISLEIILALSPILILFLIFQKVSFKQSKKSVARILIGLGFTFIGLVLFLVGVNAGFMKVGSSLGFAIASLDGNVYLILIGFVLGLVTVLAEPAVHVLTTQIEEVTGGYVRRKVVLGTLSLGVGVAVALSMVRVLVPAIQLWHYLLPGYLIAVGLMFVTPKIFVGMAYDSGGVASGPMTATFILAFIQGAASGAEGANVLVDGFGMIAMVALTPIIALQILGIIFKVKSKKGGLEDDGM